LKLLFRFYLLCNNCNWEFTGFAVPGTVSSKSGRSKKKQSATSTPDKKDDTETLEKNRVSHNEQFKTKKRVKVKYRV
jgi:hypothetical protein